jgi:hypothetical protein
MQALCGGPPTGGLSFPLQIQSQPTHQVGSCSDPVNRLLHLAMPPISSLDCVGTYFPHIMTALSLNFLPPDFMSEWAVASSLG